MNEDIYESKSDGPTRRQRIGRVLFVIGCILASFSVVSFLTVSAAAFSGFAIDVVAYAGLVTPLGVLGVVLILVGLTMALLPDGPSQDGVWVMMMGPYAGRN